MISSLLLISMPGPAEWGVILVIALIIFGPGKLPDVGKGIGKAIREFRKSSQGASEEITAAITMENNVTAEQKGKFETAKSMLKDGLDIEKIAQYTGLSIGEVKQLEA